MKGVRIYLSEHGWMVDTIVALNVFELSAAIEYHKKVVLSRMTRASREKKEHVSALLAQLTPASIKQNLVTRYPWEREKTLYLNHT